MIVWKEYIINWLEIIRQKNWMPSIISNQFFICPNTFLNVYPNIPLNIPRDKIPMMIPANITPAMTAITLFLKSISRIEAAKVPVQAPVPGSGIPTKMNKAQ